MTEYDFVADWLDLCECMKPELEYVSVSEPEYS